ncbi:hypothetical protein BK654_03850 [Pseudomonas brassicacearum]|nr:hypothetical protein BK654_03850 [Pseudomonas brassicacearum]
MEDYDAGIPARLVEGGLLCIVDPWLSMEIGDAFNFYWSDSTAPVWSTTIDLNQKGHRLAFRIDEGHIVRGDAFPVFYSVLRVGAAQPVESLPQWKLLVKLDPPGGFDPDQGTPGHSGLEYSIPQDIIDNGVGPEEAAAGVPITIKPYKHMRRNDRINVAWGTENVYRTVAAGEENTAIIITIPQEVIERAEDSDALAVAYQVVDECGNYPGGYWRWSAVTHILVDLNNNRLDAPLVLVNGFPVEEIDLAELAGNPVTVRVTANRYEHAVGDVLRLTWRGTAADSSPVIVGPLEETVQTIPYFYDFTIPHADVAAIAKGRASVGYVRIRSGEKDLPSKSTSVTVIGDARQYLAPDIVEAVGGTLDPDLNFYTLSVPYYPGRTAGDEIIIICDGRTSTTLPTYHEVTAIVGGEPVGAPVLANLAKEQVMRLDGGSLTVYYSVNGQPESEHLVLSVGVAAPSLPIPTVVEAPNDVLNPDDVNPVIGANVIATHTATIPDDVVVLRWRGSSSNAPDQSRTLTGNTAGKAVPFTVPFRYVTENLNGTVDVSYSVTRGTTLLGNSVVRHLTVGSVLDLKPPSVKEALGDQINLIDVPNGATVQIPIETALKDGDSGLVRWVGLSGAGSIEVPFNVVAGDEGKIKEISVPRSVVEANVDRSITLDYLLQRHGSESAVPSESAVYDVRQQAGSGQLLVMGARANSFGYWTRRRGAIYLVALDATTRQPLEALWQYEGDVEEVRASRFRDTQPWRLLRVHTINDQVRLNPANVFASGNASLSGLQEGAFAARRDGGSLVGWGVAGYGGSIPEPIAALNDILEVTGGLAVFVARKSNGQVVAWGDRNHGGVVPEPVSELRDIVEVTSTQLAFVARRTNGRVIAWGNSLYGGSVPESIANLSDIVEVTGAHRAFAARRITGQVVAWGYPGGTESNPPGAITDLIDIVEVTGASDAFAVRRTNGQVAAWGGNGGTVPEAISMLEDIIEVAGSNLAFAARRANGCVVGWGSVDFGGSIPEPIAALDDIVEVIGSQGAFVALRASGHVVGWGNISYGGGIPLLIGELKDIVKVTSNYGAFAALRSNGTVVTWGHPGWGGDSSAVIDQLVDVRAIYSNAVAFVALTADGRVVTWGKADSGGDSEAVQGELRGQLSYYATAASRGAVLKWQARGGLLIGG